MSSKLVILLAAGTFALLPQSAIGRGPSVGAVYTLTNAAEHNEVLVLEREQDGTLRPARSFDAGGLGTGAGLGSQGALALSRDERFLFAVNAGSDEVSSFSVTRDGLHLVNVVPSRGRNPISLTVDGHLLYVLNAGGTVGAQDNVAGFRLRVDGGLTPIEDSERGLSEDSTNPAQIQFSPDGRVLVVTEKDTNRIDTFAVGEDGLATGPQVHESAGTTPFGFAFGKRGQLFVSEAAGGADGGSSLSSYVLNADGSLETRSASVPTTETSACWALVTLDGRSVFTANTGSGTISGFRITFAGVVRLLDRDGETAITGNESRPADLALSNDGRYVYDRTPGTNSILAFRTLPDGRLEPIRGAHRVPGSSAGLVAR